MLTRVRHVVPAVAALSLIGLAAPAIALAGGHPKCNASACKVYVEPNAPTAGGQHQQQQPAPSGSGQRSGAQQSSGNQTQPSKLARVLAQAGTDKVPLSRLLGEDAGVGNLHGGGGSGPSLLGGVFDLGTGPTVLLAILLATAAGLAAHSGVRGWRRRQPSA